jgi:hypothetical protein
MFRASLYIALCTAKNRIRLRLRRLREPRYLIGAVLGAAYLLFVLVVPRRVGGRRRRGNAFPAAAAFERTALSLGSVGLTLMAALSWMLPTSSQLLSFTEAETDLLFPAPVSRRQLVIHRLVRSQLGLLFAATIPAFLIAGSATIAERLLRAIALWITFATFRVYFAGVTLARANLNAPVARARVLAWAPAVIVALAVVIVAAPIVQAVRELPVRSVTAALAAVHGVATTGLPAIVLWPARALVAPLFAGNASAFLAPIAESLLVLTAAIAWVLKSDDVFQNAGAEPVVARSSAAIRERAGLPRLRGTRWPLPLDGRGETLFLWKNGMQTLRELNAKSVVPLVLLAAYAVVGVRFGMSTSVAAAVCLAALVLAAGAMLLGPGSVMNDLRGDLRHLELLKTWPIKGSVVIRGEMLWPGLLLTGCTWCLIAAAMVLSGAAFPRLGLDWRLSLGATAMIMVPALIFAQYTIHQAAAVMFPAWVPADNDMRGFESMAHRLLLFAAVVVALIAIVGPGAIAGGLVSFVFYRLLNTPFVFVAGAGVCLVVVAIELVLATEALGPMFDRIDLAGVERAE